MLLSISKSIVVGSLLAMTVSAHSAPAVRGPLFDGVVAERMDKKAASKPDDATKSDLSKSTLLLVGNWTGLVSQPNSSAEKSYTIDIEFFVARDSMRFLTYYPELQCGGGGKLTRELANGASFFEEITQGHARCIDGEFLVTWRQDKKLFWDWGGNQATAVLERN